MTDHEQPAAGVADYRNFPGHSMCCRCVSCENANRNRDLWFPGDPPRAPTDAGGAVSEGGRGKSRGQVAYEGWSMGLPGCEWANQTQTQKRAWEASAAAVLNAAPSPQPLQQGGEVTRAKIERAGIWANVPDDKSLAGMGVFYAFEAGKRAATDAILALFASPDLGDLAGLVERLEAMEIDPHAPGLRHTSLVNPDGPEAARAIRSLAADRDKAVGLAEKLSVAISWLDYPFVDNNTSEDELRRRVGLMMKDAEPHRAFLSSQTEAR